eukprot:SAG31_NODE_4070_length_3601_cov_2.171023_5_plen_159_part_00
MVLNLVNLGTKFSTAVDLPVLSSTWISNEYSKFTIYIYRLVPRHVDYSVPGTSTKFSTYDTAVDLNLAFKIQRSVASYSTSTSSYRGNNHLSQVLEYVRTWYAYLPVFKIPPGCTMAHGHGLYLNLGTIKYLKIKPQKGTQEVGGMFVQCFTLSVKGL